MQTLKLNNIQIRNAKDVINRNWGANMQTGFTEDDVPYLYIKHGPNLPAIRWEFHSDGTILGGEGDWNGTDFHE